MKYVAYCEGVATPAYVLIEEEIDIESLLANVEISLVCKTGESGR
jgi:phosphoribosylaminoimidazole carboxylase (NCAIR synthetase)